MSKNVAGDIEALTVSAFWLAEVCQVSPRRVRQLAAAGVFIRVGRGKYDVSRSIQGYARLLEQRGDEALHTSATRLQDRKRQRLELSIAREERELIHITEADAGIQEVCDAVLEEVDMIGREAAREIGKDRTDRGRILSIVADGRVRLDLRFARAREKLRTGRLCD